VQGSSPVLLFYSFIVVHQNSFLYFTAVFALTVDARASVWFNFLFFLPLLLLVRGRTSEPGEGIVDIGLSHSILPLRGGMTSSQHRRFSLVGHSKTMVKEMGYY